MEFWGLFGFRDLGEKLCVSWALSLIECVAVWALKLPVPHTDALKTHSSQSPSPRLRKPKKLPLIFFVLGVFIGSVTTLFACFAS